MKLTIEIAPGELLDKISILKIKQERIQDKEKLKHIQTELDLLNRTAERLIKLTSPLNDLCSQLRAANEELWQIEDDIRRYESKKDFGDKFIQLARNVYKTNDTRSMLKRRINELLGSRIIEEKSYSLY